MDKEKRKVINRNFPIALATTVVLALLILTSNTAILARFGGTINSPQPSTTDVSVPEGGAGGAAPLPAGTTDIIGAATTDGRFITEATASSVDGQCSINIPRGTVGLTADRQPLTQISITPNTAPPEPPANSSVIGLVYNLGPEGATFDPPITVSFTYDPNKLTAGVNEKNFAITVYNKATSKWVKLSNIKIDNVKHTIRGQTNHFTAFSIIAYLASFSLSSLTISPAEVNIGDIVNINADIANNGDVTGSYNATLIINDTPVSSRPITLAGHTSEKITFITTINDTGTHFIKIGTLSKTFEVKVPTSTTPTNWGLIGGLIAAIVAIITLLVYFLWWKRRLA